MGELTEGVNWLAVVVGTVLSFHFGLALVFAMAVCQQMDGGRWTSKPD